jgi:hypothetical protein
MLNPKRRSIPASMRKRYSLKKEERKEEQNGD